MKIESFSDEHRWLSNFAPVEVFLEGRTFSSVEHAYQSAKSDKLEWKETCSDYTNTAGKIKRLSKEILVKENWNDMRKGIMRNLLSQKFNQEPYMTLLIATGNAEIEEGNNWGDVFWGVSLKNGVGQNNLGKMIMEIRDSFRTKPLF